MESVRGARGRPEVRLLTEGVKAGGTYLARGTLSRSAYASYKYSLQQTTHALATTDRAAGRALAVTFRSQLRCVTSARHCSYDVTARRLRYQCHRECKPSAHTNSV
ncbi:jg22508 [Pararge aegeria aegeria]|uniref:Jg22508 protein n=1 Tax=Pararge aegeria aegeria TaxID=348720 RepID=A0A8S4QJU1_9NEOP|nr:jg22508 [Pararge aegeria aegeria]